jgi:hypothetical protein
MKWARGIIENKQLNIIGQQSYLPVCELSQFLRCVHKLYAYWRGSYYSNLRDEEAQDKRLSNVAIFIL